MIVRETPRVYEYNNDVLTVPTLSVTTYASLPSLVFVMFLGVKTDIVPLSPF